MLLRGWGLNLGSGWDWDTTYSPKSLLDQGATTASASIRLKSASRLTSVAPMVRAVEFEVGVVVGGIGGNGLAWQGGEQLERFRLKLVSPSPLRDALYAEHYFPTDDCAGDYVVIVANRLEPAGDFCIFAHNPADRVRIEKIDHNFVRRVGAIGPGSRPAAITASSSSTSEAVR